GRYNNFQGGAISWSPASGAHETHGAIRTKWLATGAESGCLGYPVSDQYAFNGGQKQDYQNGNIITDAGGVTTSSCGAPPPPPPPLVTVIVDNSDAGFTASASWVTSTGSTQKYGADYRYRSTAAISDSATWSTSIATAGNYNVYAWWSTGSNRSLTAPYIVSTAAGSVTVNKNQQLNGGVWNLIGTYSLNAGVNTVKLSCWTTTNSVVIADAVKWVQQ
ncbi:MAG: hypothetical protein ACR2H1_05865, partial [Limisphaerales bacterium]